MNTYICTLDKKIQEEIINLAKSTGYEDNEIALMLNSRVCDLEDTFPIKLNTIY